MNDPQDGAPSPVLFFQTLTAYQKSAALKAAIELDLFTAIGDGPATASAIAERCRAAERGVRTLCDYLTILGFIAKTAERYSLTSDSAVFLNRNSPAYAGGAAEFLTSSSLTTAFEHLSDAVRKGGTAQSSEGTMAPEHPVWIAFARGMAPMMWPPAEMLADLLPIETDRPMKILDISASHGVWGIALARRAPNAHLVAVDWAPVLQVARENANAAGLQNRFTAIAGSAFDVDFGRDFDVVLIPNFLHHFDADTCVKLLRKVHSALRTGGRVAIAEFVPNADRITPPDAAAFSLVMLATTANGNAYTFKEFEHMLGDSGFSAVEQHPLSPTAATAIIARK